MTNLNDRGTAHENKFTHDTEMQFKAIARRNRLLGEWIGTNLGYTGEKLSEYAKTVVIADLKEPGDDDVVKKVLHDLELAKITAITEDKVRERLVTYMNEAITQLSDN